MPEFTAQTIVFLLGVGGLTLATAVTDVRFKRIPNTITVPAFAAGLLYQGVFNGLPGLLDGVAGFAVGFGLLFLLWLVGGGGGGDVKLMGALSVWLGFQPTLYVLTASTVVVIAIALGVTVWSVVARGSRNTKRKYVGTGKPGRRRAETVAEKQSRRITPYAVPVAVATWAVVAWQLDTLLGPTPADTDRETAATSSEMRGDVRR